MIEQKLTIEDFENVEDLINVIKKQFNLTFLRGEFDDVDSFDELFDTILKRIKLKDIDDCTSQQFFYKLQRALVELNVVDLAQEITPSTRLDSLFADKQNVRKVEKKLDIKLQIFQPNESLESAFWVVELISFVVAFFDWKIGLSSLFVSSICLYCIYATAKNMSYTTIRDLISSLLNDNYLKLRREKRTVNKKELKKIWMTEFAYSLNIEEGRMHLIRFK